MPVSSNLNKIVRQSDQTKAAVTTVPKMTTMIVAPEIAFKRVCPRFTLINIDAISSEINCAVQYDTGHYSKIFCKVWENFNFTAVGP